MDLVRVFSYGSNLSPRRIGRRIATARLVATGFACGYDLRFHKAGTDGSGKADAYRTGNDDERVWGAVYEMTADERARLDRFEGGYSLAPVEVVVQGASSLAAVVYVADRDRIDASVRPYVWYKRYVVDGAREHGFPAAYVASLEAVEALDDPDRDRHRRAMADLGIE